MSRRKGCRHTWVEKTGSRDKPFKVCRECGKRPGDKPPEPQRVTPFLVGFLDQLRRPKTAGREKARRVRQMQRDSAARIEQLERNRAEALKRWEDYEARRQRGEVEPGEPIPVKPHTPGWKIPSGLEVEL